MDLSEFKSLADGVYEFETYMGQKIIGIPVFSLISENEYYYIIDQFKVYEYNYMSNSFKDNIDKGIIYLINPDVIDTYKKIS